VPIVGAQDIMWIIRTRAAHWAVLHRRLHA